MSGLATAGFAAAGQGAEAAGDPDPFAVQDARAKLIDKFANTAYYPADAFNLDDLPRYVPERKVSGTLLSREAQEAVARDGKMLPLTADRIRTERQKLE